MARIEGYDEGVDADHSHTGGGILPAGDYVGEITDSDVVENNNRTGQVLKLEYALLNDGFKGRKVWQNINIQHTASPKAHEIGQRELANLKDVLGIAKGTRLSDTLQLHGKPVGLVLKIELGGPKVNGPGNYPDKNQVAAFFFANEFGSEGRGINAAAAPATAPAPRPAAAPAAAPASAPAAAAPAATPPWMKRQVAA